MKRLNEEIENELKTALNDGRWVSLRGTWFKCGYSGGFQCKWKRKTSGKVTKC